jgi:tripartite-type tricarboxylate transporter receptor subunit TctC
MKKLSVLLMFYLSILLVVGCSAQNKVSSTEKEKKSFPEKDITLVVPFAAGGASDSTSRVIAKKMEKELGKPVIIVNKPGGTGAVGMSFVEASPNDGYTLSYVPVEMTMQKPLGLSDIEPSKFDLLAQATMIPAALTVPVDAPYNTIEEFVDYAKKNPGKIKFGNSGTGSIWHVAATTLADKMGTEFSHIPFEGGAPAVTALMGGHVDAVAVSVGEVKSGVEAKKLKVLGVMSADRDPNFPDVPTFKEKGIDAEIVGWGGFVVPKDTPKDVKEKLASSIEKAVNSDEFKEFAKIQGMTITYKGPEDFSEFANSQFDMYSELIPKMDLK